MFQKYKHNNRTIDKILNIYLNYLSILDTLDTYPRATSAGNVVIDALRELFADEGRQ